MLLKLVIFCALIMSTMAQRPSFAGSRPASGYKDGYVQQQASTNNNNNGGGRGFIGSRTDASNLPIDQRPYWLLNQQPIEAQRGIPSQLPAGLSQFNSGLDFPTRFNPNGNAGTFNSITQPIGSNQNIGSQQPGIVYSSNITPQQRINMEIQFLQQRLNQLQQQNGGRLR